MSRSQNSCAPSKRRQRTFLGLAAVFIALAIVACGGDEGDDPPEGTRRYEVTFTGQATSKSRGGTLFSVIDPQGRVRMSAGLPSTWNTYCGNQPGEVHFFVGGQGGPAAWERVTRPDPVMRTAYAFARDGQLHVRDMGNERSYRAASGTEAEKTSSWQQLPQSLAALCGSFEVGSWEYRQDGADLVACSSAPDAADCDRIAIHAQTFPYAYAEANGRVLVATNWGDILIHRAGQGWCRAAQQGQRLACPTEGSVLPVPEAPRGFQFYSSARFGDHTLLGRWPGGAVYEFDGDALAPHDDTPPLPQDDVTANSEAQSMAVYCGNLYVGYWPRGDLWMRSSVDGVWHYAGRAFSHPEAPEPAVPYIDRPIPEMDAAFLGQRITSLTPQGDSLYLTTSNLRGWYKSIPTPDFLSEAQAAEYGRLWRLRQAGCATAHVKERATTTLHFDISPTEIRIRQDRVTLAAAVNPGVMPQDGDTLVVGDGVFGALGATVTVKRTH